MTPLSAADACAREPIQHLGMIQPHGVLVSVAMPDWTVRQASLNVEALLGITAEALIGESLRDYVDDHVLEQVADAVSLTSPGAPPLRAGMSNIGLEALMCEMSVHTNDRLVHLEIEPQPGRGAPTPVSAQSMIARIASIDDADTFDRRVVEQMRQLIGFDRVMLYRFRHDDAGEVVAESHDEAMEPYLGLRYPASDIPVQARRLYLHSRIRLIADVAAANVAVHPGLLPQGTPMDMSQHALRSVSPVHIEYLHNMGVGASMSVSVVVGGRLWGLIACHHRTRRVLSPSLRAQAELFGMFVSMRVAAREQDAVLRRTEYAQTVRDAIAAKLREASDADEALAGQLPGIARLLDADGSALWSAGRWHVHGQAPSQEAVAHLQAWLATLDGPDLALTDRADDWNAPAPLAGVLAMRVGRDEARVFVFRTEQVEIVEWAGNPEKAVSTDDGVRMAPRRSFESWREEVCGTSAPWSDADIRGADRLGRLLRVQRRRGGSVGASDALRRQDLDGHRAQLDQLAGLLDGMVHLDDAGRRELGDRIADLHGQMQKLMGTTPT